MYNYLPLVNSSALRVTATGCVWLLKISGYADNSTPSGVHIANEIAAEDFGSDSCATDHHGKTRTLADIAMIVHACTAFGRETYDSCYTDYAKRVSGRTRYRQ